MASEQQVFVVVGASRGIGLEIVCQLSTRSSAIIYAGVRSPSSSPTLQKLAASKPNVKLITTDLSNTQSFATAVKEVEKQVSGVDVLIVNGGQNDYSRAVDGNVEMLQKLLDVNTVGPFRAISAFLPLLRKRSTKKVISVSSTGGSMTLNEQLSAVISAHAAYNISKTSLNAVTRQFASELKAEGFTVISVCPGVAETDMSKEATTHYPKAAVEAFAPLRVTAEESAKYLLHITDSITPEKNGSFLNHKFETLPY